MPERDERYRFPDGVIQGTLAFLIVFSPLAFGSVEVWSLTVLELAVFLMGLAWLVKKGLAGGERTVVWTPLELPLIMLVALMALQLIPLPFADRVWNPSHMMLLPGSLYWTATKAEFIRILCLVLVYFLVVNVADSRKRILRLVALIVAVGFILSLLGIVQKLSGTERVLWFRKPPEIAMSFFASYVNGNHFAGLISMIVPLAVGLLLARRKGWPGSLKILLCSTIVVMSVAVFLSMSRAGVLALGTSLFALTAMLIVGGGSRQRYRTVFVVVLLTVLLLAWIGADPVVSELASLSGVQDSLSYSVRRSVWSSSFDLIGDYFLFGTGAGTYRYVFPRYKEPEASMFFSHAHNDYIEFVAEMGILGAIILLFGGYRFFKDIVLCHLFGVTQGIGHSAREDRPLRWGKRHDPFARNLTIGGVAAVIAIAFHSLVDFNLHIPANALFLSVILGITTVAAHTRVRHGREDTLIAKRALPVGKATNLALLAACGSIVFLAVTATRHCLADLVFRHARKAALSGDISTKGDQSLAMQSGGSLERSQALLSTVLFLEPSRAEYVYALGRSYLNGGFSGSRAMQALALEKFIAARNLNPTNSQYCQSVAWAYGNLGLRDDALRYFEQSVRLDPSNSYRHRTYALYCFNQALRLPDNDAPSTTTRVQLVRTGVAEFRRAVEIDPSLAREALLTYFGFTRDYDALKEIVPDTYNAYRSLALVLIENGAWDQNEHAYLEDTVAAEDGVHRYVALADALANTGQAQRAVSVLLQCAATDGDEAVVHFKIADIARTYPSRYEWPFVESEYRKAIEMAPSNPFFRYWYAVELFRHRKYDLALAEQRIILQQEPENPDAHFMSGQCYERLGAADEALAMYSRAIALDPDNREYRQRVADLSHANRDVLDR